MLTNLFFPHGAGVRVDRLWRDGGALHLGVVATRRWARCPLCQAMGKLVDHLARYGYVERVPDPSDGRAKLVRLTAQRLETYALAGHRTLGMVFGGWGSVLRDWTDYSAKTPARLAVRSGRERPSVPRIAMETRHDD